MHNIDEFNQALKQTKSSEDLLQLLVSCLDADVLEVDLIAEQVVMHPWVNQDVLELLLKHDCNANIVATSGRAGETILQRLSLSDDPFVREHALIGLALNKLEHAGDEEFQSMAATYTGESGLDLAVRWALARHANTPRAVLALLIEAGGADFITEAAQDNMRKRFAE